MATSQPMKMKDIRKASDFRYKQIPVIHVVIINFLLSKITQLPGFSQEQRRYTILLWHNIVIYTS